MGVGHDRVVVIDAERPFLRIDFAGTSSRKVWANAYEARDFAHRDGRIGRRVDGAAAAAVIGGVDLERRRDWRSHAA